MTDNLALGTVSAGALEIPFNDATRGLDAYLTEAGAFSISGGNGAISAAAWRRYAYFGISGSGANRRVTLPALKGMKTFRNGSNNDITLVLGAVTVTVAEAETALIYSTGAALYKVGGSQAAASVWPGTQTPVPTLISHFSASVYRIGATNTTLAGVWEENADYGLWDPSNVTPGTGLRRNLSDAFATLTAAAYAAAVDAGPGFVCQFHITIPNVSSYLGWDWWDQPSFAQDGGGRIGLDRLSVFTPYSQTGEGGIVTSSLPFGTYKIVIAATPEVVVAKADNGLLVTGSDTNATPTIDTFSISMAGGTDIIVHSMIFFQVEADLDLALAYDYSNPSDGTLLLEGGDAFLLEDGTSFLLLD